MDRFQFSAKKYLTVRLEIVERKVDLLEGRPLVEVILPTLEHQLIKVIRDEGRLLEPQTATQSRRQILDLDLGVRCSA